MWADVGVFDRTQNAATQQKNPTEETRCSARAQQQVLRAP